MSSVLRSSGLLRKIIVQDNGLAEFFENLLLEHTYFWIKTYYL